MSDQLKNFGFYNPVLSTDIVKVAPAVPTYQAPEYEKNLIKSAKIPKSKQKKQGDNSQPAPRKVETQEEIDAWIAERRKKFPTRVRVDEKEQTELERRERGALDLSKPRPTEKNESKKPIEMSTINPVPIPSLLEVLTEDERRKDYSRILQCFRYFVKHDFLQTPYKESNPSNTE
ncbi:hypothetical protein TVAG_038290 [Trichomonas vaginalis G3]|uniref:FMR1-interacting protein 1 conserved domain-containing protein n=1 Tax=Trichomonas vaginalis (strain ATCC PRA-98 / G3) TaxID=412133 RepID=A2DXY7_TRIV3|nr:Nuclear fragile X mental retardation-interacting protein 1 (NUFIP1) family [Trichomonas vaginalis G3]EAY14723.1 hypothetical protein TVAG_038290 [Trichomonas vaginalis G3]KAI5487906.1 Nuclear fragile X mental retardation-interacting protein 1 (NUFIP1) family [Trichomonas vaginalis G3]|eukprot:XP_001326946.1 hypothetical protein [Trichomonas vaginalis G3]